MKTSYFRNAIIAGNWKMNNTAKEGVALVNALKPLVKDASCEVVVCVPAIDIPAVAEALEGSNIALGAQNVHYAERGAYTGEISAEMLREYGVKYVIIGHSERRQYFGETDDTVNMRALTAIREGITPIICVGETLQEREGGRTKRVLSRQLQEGLANIPDISKIVIEANETIGYIRRKCAEVFCPECAAKVRIQYGGSMNAGNCRQLMDMPEIDGGLIGGASLKAKDFAEIVHFDKGIKGMRLPKDLM